jgi:dipeptidyl aminopeptidase/acylaminoacyl peptidase
MDSPKFSQFNVTKTPYKTINNTQIPLWVLIPKTISANKAKAPIFVHFHGGFLISGTALYPDWSSQYILDYQLQSNAIRISPNYRLLPESTGSDILSDLTSAWKWIAEDLPGYLKSIGSEIIPDYNHVMVFGESAGGYLALQSALLNRSLIKAVIAAYPMIYLDSAWYSLPSDTKSPFGTPQLPKQILDEHIKKIERGNIVSEGGMERVPLAISAVQQGRFKELLGEEEGIYLDNVLGKVKEGGKGPFLFAFHGKEDSAVPVEETEKWVGEWKGKFGEQSVVIALEEGDHGFDHDVTLETSWVKSGLEEVTKVWLG